MKLVRIVVVACVLALGVAACGGDDDETARTATSPEEALGRAGGAVVTVDYSQPDGEMVPIFDRFSSRYPNVSLETVSGSDAENADELLRLGKEAHDDVFLATDEQVLERLAAEGVLAPLPQELRDLGTDDGDPQGRWARMGGELGYAAILRGTDEPQEARAFVRFVLEQARATG
jgi:ABC-type glycerol-3-phosphate transport system substrate-binding protein